MKVVITALLGVFLVILSGCSAKHQVLNIQNQAITSQGELTLQELEKSILSAGSSLRWNMTKVSDGEIVANINVRKHFAEVRILYNTQGYSILYVKSENLNYNPSNNTIHKAYNGWIKNLSEAINRASGLPESVVAVQANRVSTPQSQDRTSECKFSFTGSLMSGRNFQAEQIYSDTTISQSVTKSVRALTSKGIVISSIDKEIGLVSGTAPRRGHTQGVSLMFAPESDQKIYGKLNITVPGGYTVNANDAKNIMCGIMAEVR